MVSSCDIDFRQRYGWIRTPQLERQWGPAREIRQPTENGESLLRFNNGQVLSHLDNNNGQGLPPWTTAEVCHPRIMASCFFASWIWQPFANCNRTTAEACHPRIMASCFFASWIWQPFANCNRTTAEVCHPRIMASCFFASWIWQPFANCNRTTAEACHPRIMASCFFASWIWQPFANCNRTTAEVCHPRIMASCFSQVESDTRLQIAIGLRPRFVTLGLWLLAFASWIWQPFANCNRTTAEVCHPRIMASCFRNWSLATVCTCNRITAEVCHPRIIAYCICNWNLTTVCILQSEDGESQLRFEHWRASFHAVQASKTTTLWLPKRRKRYLAVSIENKSKNQTNTHATGWFETDS